LMYGVRMGVFAAVSSSLLYSALLLAEFTRLIPHVSFNLLNPVYIHQDMFYLCIKLLSDNVLFIVTAVISGILSERLLRSKNELEKSNKEILKMQGTLQKYMNDLENTVAERTQELTTANEQLRREITERKLAERKYTTIIQTSLDGYWIVDLQGRFLDVNDSYCRMIGYSREELFTMSLADVEASEKPEEIAQHIKKIMERGYDRFETRHRCKDGKILDIEVSANYIHAEGGQLFVFARDIAERKLAEEALRESGEKYRTLMDSIDIGFFETDLAGNFVFFNDTIRTFLGYSETELLGMNYGQYVDKENAGIIYQAFNTVYRTEQADKGFVCTIVSKDGTKRPVEFSVSLVHDDNGQPIAFRGLTCDITEKKQLEQQLLQAQKMESIGTLAGGIAHDFNNILGGILGYASFMKSKIQADHPFFKYLDTIERSSTRAAELTAQLLGFARGGKYDTKPLDLNEAVKETLEIIERTIDKSIAIETQMSESLPTVAADGGQLQQVLMNLFINAADAMPAGGKLIIETDIEMVTKEYVRTHAGIRPGPYVKLAVTDTGIGMDNETQKRIFEPFFTTKKEGKGTGLGLSMVYGVVKNHGGYITVYSEPGHGTTFKIYMPASGKAEDEKALETPVQYGRDELILVVDDEETIRDFARDVLEGNGYRVILAEDGAQAVRVFEEHDGDISLVILDMVMPNMGGHEAFLRMRASNPKVRALLSTGYSQNGKAQKILDSGIKGFLQKPYQPNALLSNVRSVIDAES